MLTCSYGQQIRSDNRVIIFIMRRVHRAPSVCKSDITNFDLSPNNLCGKPIIPRKTMSLICDSRTYNYLLNVSRYLNVLSMVMSNFYFEREIEGGLKGRKKEREKGNTRHY